MQNHWLFSSNNIYFCKCQKADGIKKAKRTRKFRNNQIRLIAVRKQNVSYYKPVTFNELNCSCFRHVINILLTELSRSVWENLDLGRVYRPHCVRYVLTTSVKILPYRPPTRLIAGSRRARNLVCTPHLDFGGNLFCQNRSINPRKPIRSHFHSNKIF